MKNTNKNNVVKDNVTNNNLKDNITQNKNINNNTSNNISKKIGVVGAGIAGLSCAYELQKAGYDVVVFEKNDYVGGRMASRAKKGLLFDIGANFLIEHYQNTKEYCFFYPKTHQVPHHKEERFLFQYTSI